MFSKITPLLLAIGCFVPSLFATEPDRAISFEYAIKISNPDIVSWFICQLDIFDNEKKEQLLTLAQDVITSRHNAVIAAETTGPCVEDWDIDEFVSYRSKHLMLPGLLGFWNRVWNMLDRPKVNEWPPDGLLTRLEFITYDHALILGGCSVFFQAAKQYILRGGVLGFVSDYRSWLSLGVTVIGYHTNKRVDSLLGREFLKKKYYDALEVKNIIFEADIFTVNSAKKTA